MTQKRWIAVAALTLAAVAPALAQDEEGAQTETVDTIVIEISNLQNDGGQIGCSLFSKEDGFPMKADKADKRLWVRSKSKKATCTFSGMKAGAYAIAVVHDADENGELNTSFVGRPKEWWGVSNNAPAHRFGPPKFEEAKFQYEGGKKTLKVKLQL